MAINFRSYIKEAERFYIETELRRNTPVPDIARALNRDKSTIYAEIRRGSCSQVKSTSCGYETISVYYADHAERLACRRQAVKGTSLKIGRDLQLAAAIEEGIKEKHWSPAMIIGRLKREGKLSVSLTSRTIYNYIEKQVLDIEKKDLPMHGLRKRAAARRAKKAKAPTRGKPIDLRPESVIHRREFGHWEGDLVVGKQGSKTVVLTLLERKTRFYITVELPNRKAQTIVAAIDKLEKKFGRMWQHVFKTITFDNGSEFADSYALERSRFKSKRDANGEGGRCQVYYAHPYRSCERGSNENCNGLLRRGGVTKGKNIATLPRGTVKKASQWVNDLPRAILNFMTAAEAFDQEIGAIVAT